MVAEVAKRIRRVYAPGRCDDCGWHRSVTRITFWLNGFQMNVCADCIKPYRKVILKPSAIPVPAQPESLRRAYRG